MIYNSSVKERITTAMGFFVVSIVVAIALWAIFAPFTLRSFVGMGMAMTAAYIMRYLSSSQQLLRVRSWSVSSVFLILIGVTGPIHQWDVSVWTIAALYLIHIGGLIASCQADKPERGTLLSAIALALLTMFEPRTIVLLPMCIVAMMAAMRSMTMRTFLALVMGLLLPYEVWCAAHVAIGDLPHAVRTLGADISYIALPTIEFGTNTWATLSALLTLPFCIMATVVFFSLCSIYYYSVNSYNDKIRTRLQYFTIMLEWPALLILLLMAPGSLAVACVLMIACASPVMGNYFLFSKGLLANILFTLFLLLCAFLALQLF